MKILYVTDLFSGLEPLIFSGSKQIHGSPAFYYPFEKLINRGHKIDIIAPIFQSKKIINIRCQIFKDSRIMLFHYRRNILLRIIYDILLIMYISRKIRKYNYDFVYGHGSFGIYGTIAAKLLNIPCASRIYGSFLYFKINNINKLAIGLRYYRQYLPFITRKNFLLMTNDGTRGDKLYDKIGHKGKYKFYYLLNGVDRPIKSCQKELKISNIIIYPARIAKWKNQQYAIDIIESLEILGESQIMLYITGSISDKNYLDYLNKYITEKGLNHRIKYLGSISRDQLFGYYTNSFGVLSFYDFSNLGNVTIETLVYGGLLISKNDNSLDGIVTNLVNGILASSPIEAAKNIISLQNDSELYYKIRYNALTMAESQFKSWDDRSNLEVDLIEKACSDK